jgi:hypothetical protein
VHELFTERILTRRNGSGEDSLAIFANGCAERATTVGLSSFQVKNGWYCRNSPRRCSKSSREARNANELSSEHHVFDLTLDERENEVTEITGYIQWGALHISRLRRLLVSCVLSEKHVPARAQKSAELTKISSFSGYNPHVFPARARSSHRRGNWANVSPRYFFRLSCFASTCIY